ncbi:MAG: STAS domain-containing protein [Rhodoferax sp.]|nr:STAS domain-containing protein [Rhodoferax sp.]
MPIEFQDNSDALRTVRITGRMDLVGTDEIATRFTALTAASGRRLVVDLTGVVFLASIGIRALITNAKALQQRGGRTVIYVGDNQAVYKTLETTGVDSLIPLFTDLAAAQQAATA